MTDETLRNTPEETLRRQAQEIKRLEQVVERLSWRNRNQKGEIRRLNRAMIERNYLVAKWGSEVAEIRGTNNEIASG